ncbi:bifunctional serine/threonine-protein kinase/transporter substrate-binding domain-containing protein [Streptomyces sp. NPDC048506]|uniref:bifunctional serine/threonine-protein kinase/transporter substrate-binding domain-containing protein n=1 Tax=Streptomyces sp. NPDC048506 TaxID=3155028 RepID=UPI0034488D7C
MGVWVRPLAKGDPQQIGPFRIVGLLGGGGMGRVYLGRAADGRMVAVKTARSELADDRGFRTRFAREVAAAQRVGGPFVAPVVDAAPHDDVPWMATAYVPGVSLADAVHDGGPLPEHVVRPLTAGLLHALAAVHAHGLVHRDLKPSNILLTTEGPRVIDFGIAYSAADTALTTTGTALGTPGFMAPEQLAMTGPKVTGAADVFALGGVIVYATTGGGPYGNAEPQILMYRTVHEEPRIDELPVGLRELAAACLAKKPERRPALPALMARVGTPGPYGDWLPETVAAPLRRLSAQLRDAGSADAHALRPPAEGPVDVPYDQLPTRTAAADGAPPPPAYGAMPPWPAHSPAPPLPDSPGRPVSPGPSRRRLLAALSVIGGVAGSGALAWALWPDGGSGGASAGNQPGGGGTSTGKQHGGGGQPAGGLPAAIRDRGFVTVGSDITYAPMEFTSGGAPAGVDVDLANALGRELGVRFKFVNALFGDLLAGLHSGRFDLVMSAMTDTKDRQVGGADGTRPTPGVDMIDYLTAGLTLVVRKGNPDGIRNAADLSGRTVAVQRSSAARDYMDEISRKVPGKVKVREFDSTAELYDDVAEGRSSACLDDFPVAAHTAATHSGGAALERVGRQLDPLPYGIAVAKANTALRDTVRDALDRLVRSGAYAKILKQWSMEDGAVQRVIINGGR